MWWALKQAALTIGPDDDGEDDDYDDGDGEDDTPQPKSSSSCQFQTKFGLRPYNA